jgi:hypothetical protein
MELRRPRPGFSLDALIAEAKRRARQRRLLVLLALLVVAAVAAAVTFGSSGHGSGSGSPGAAAKIGGASDGTQSLSAGPFALTVPRGFYGKTLCTDSKSCTASGMTVLQVSNHPINDHNPNAPGRVMLAISNEGRLPFAAAPLPLDVHKLHSNDVPPGRGWDGHVTVSGGPLDYDVNVWWGNKTTPAERASILRALSSIRRSG